MRDTTINKAGGSPQGSAVKRPYRQPKLQIFGKVLDLTQGKGKGSNDHHHHHHKK